MKKSKLLYFILAAIATILILPFIFLPNDITFDEFMGFLVLIVLPFVVVPIIIIYCEYHS